MITTVARIVGPRETSRKVHIRYDYQSSFCGRNMSSMYNPFDTDPNMLNDDAICLSCKSMWNKAR